MVAKRKVAQSQKGAIDAQGGIHLGNDVWLFSNAGTPVAGVAGDGATWAGKGSKCYDYTNGVDYINTNTKASPTWTKTGTQS